jgi:hypothetical protein
VEETIIRYILGLASLETASYAAGVSPRTVRDWIARGEDRHPTRSCTPKHRRFAVRIRKAQAEAKILLENRLAEKDPKSWLARIDRSTANEEASLHSGSPLLDGMQISTFTEDELNGSLARLDAVIHERVGELERRSRRPRRRVA